jgi:hypothetical protein
MDFGKMIKENDLLKVLLLLVVVYIFVKLYTRENLDNVEGEVLPMSTIPLEFAPAPPANAVLPKQYQNVQPKVVQPQTVFTPQAPVNPPSASQNAVDGIAAGNSQLTTSDLLPVYDDANAFAKENPVSKLLKSQNFLQAGFHAGINTIVQSNKIPYLDLRSCPPIPKKDVGPFNNSSYEQPAGSNRRFLEIGS